MHPPPRAVLSRPSACCFRNLESICMMSPTELQKRRTKPYPGLQPIQVIRQPNTYSESSSMKLAANCTVVDGQARDGNLPCQAHKMSK